jgi:hypothetical protein
VAGILGMPKLTGTGSLVPGTTTTITISRAAPGATGALVSGWEVANLPFLCGVLLPSPDHLLPITSDQTGSVSGSISWPALPSLTPVTFQAWFQDAAAPCGYSASNGLTATSAP